MTKDEVKSLVDAAVNPMRDMLGLQHWNLVIEYGRLDEGTQGSVSVQAAYEQATITLDAEQITDDSDALLVLRHELIHAFLWPMHEHAFGHLGVNMSDEQYRTWTFFLERMVRSIEKLLDHNRVPGLGLRDYGD